MSARRFIVVAVMVVCLGGLAAAQEEEIPLENWSAPLYWTPSVATTDAAPGHGMIARVQGLRAHALALAPTPLPFVAVTPCRIVDTRVNNADGFHSPNFGDDESRTFPFPSSTDCPGLPATAGAYSVNIQFRPMSQLSFLTAYPTGAALPGVSTLTAGPAAWVGNAAIVPAGTGGAIDIYCQFAGRVVIDVNGYYGPGSVVMSLNTLAGDVTLEEGANVTITPSGNTLTIAATGGGGTLPSGTSGQTLYYNDESGWVASSVLTNDGFGTVGVNGSLTLPETTTPFNGVINLGGPFAHNYPGVAGFNTFLGVFAGNFSVTGMGNTAVGSAALTNNSSGAFNIAVGMGAGLNNTIGTGNIYISSTGDAADNYTTRIGDNQTRAFIKGISGVNVGAGSPVYVNGSGQLGTSASSSLRFKQDVADMDDASSRLLELRPVTFRYKEAPDGPLQYGLIAEEVERVMPELVVKDAAGQPEAVAYHLLPAMLLNELQKQRGTNRAQQAQIEELQNQVRMLLEERRAAQPKE